MAYVYILKCADGSYYTGSTVNLEKRLWEHNNGMGSIHTNSNYPSELIYYEESLSIKSAFEREKQIQGWSRKKKEALIKSDFNLLLQYSRKQF